MSSAAVLTPTSVTPPAPERFSVVSESGSLDRQAIEARERTLAAEEQALLQILGAVGDERTQLLAQCAGLQAEAAKHGVSDVMAGFASVDGSLVVADLLEQGARARVDALRTREAFLQGLQERVQQFRSETHSVQEKLEQARTRIAAQEVPVSENPVPLPSADDPAAEPLKPIEINHDERREHIRHEIEAAVTFESDNNFYAGFSTDVSEGGVFIATVDMLPIGSDVSMKIKLPNGRPLELVGVVRWLREWSDQTPDVHPGMGIQFTNIGEAELHAIRGFAEQRDTLFYIDA